MSWGSGQQISQGRYEIIQRIGTGGFGVTYKAVDLKAATPNTVIAIKTLNERRQRQPNFEQLQENFLNEALSLARCSHPNVIRVERVFTEGQIWAMVMEYIEGESLEDYIMEKGRLAETKAVEIIKKIGSAASYVHSQQLLHRDIKSANILIRSNVEPVLIDFGLAREFVSGIARSMTSDRTPHYSPPEQAERRGDFTPTLDVYALAATLYTCVTGDLPTMAEIRIVRDALIEPKKLNPQLSDRVNQAIIKGMALNSADRANTVADWLELLQPALINISNRSGLVRQATTIDNDTDDANSYYDRGIDFKHNEYQLAKDAYLQGNYQIAALNIDVISRYNNNCSIRLLKRHIYSYGLNEYGVGIQEYNYVLKFSNDREFIKSAKNGLEYINSCLIQSKIKTDVLNEENLQNSISNSAHKKFQFETARIEIIDEKLNFIKQIK